LILIAWTELAWAEAAKTIRLPSGLEIYDLSGEWNALIELDGQAAAYTNVVEITVKGASCPVTGQLTEPVFISGVRREDGRADAEIIRGELTWGGLTNLEVIDAAGRAFPSQGRISAGGNKIVIEAPGYGKLTLIRK
jgi:hypothetical protein